MKKTIILTVSLALLFLFISSAFAEFQCLWKDKRLAKDIGLSEEQVDKLNDFAITTEKKMIKIRADIELKQIDLHEILDQDKPDEKKAISLVKEIMNLKTETRILKIKQMISIKETLTIEQMDKFEEFKRDHHKKKAHGGPRTGANHPGRSMKP